MSYNYILFTNYHKHTQPKNHNIEILRQTLYLSVYKIKTIYILVSYYQLSQDFKTPYISQFSPLNSILSLVGHVPVGYLVAIYFLSQYLSFLLQIKY